MKILLPWVKAKCPFCFHRFHLADVGRRSLDPGARKHADEKLGRFLGMTVPPQLAVVEYNNEPYSFGKRVLWHLKRLVLRNEPLEQYRKVCPGCHMPLPNKMANGELSSEVIAILGVRGSGKSNFFCVLLDALERRYSHEVGFRIFDQETWSIQDQKPIGSKKLWKKRCGNRLFGAQSRVAIDQTNSVETDSEVRVPLIYRLEFPKRPWHYLIRPFAPASALDLVIFDTAGEDLTNEELIEHSCRYVLGASGIIFIIDPFRYPGVYQQLPQAVRDRLERTNPTLDTHPSELVNIVIRLYERRVGVVAGGKIKVPAAFALSKSDLLKNTVDKSSLILRDSRHEGGFNLADSVRLSHEVMDCIREWDSPQLCNQAEKFKSSRFFAFSALGAMPDRDMRINAVNSLRVADPLLWILWNLGYIRTLPEE